MSRRLFYILLAANLIVLSWGTLRPRMSGEPEPPSDDPVMASLKLADEVPEPPVPHPQAEVAAAARIPAPPPNPGQCCGCVGPFQDQSLARRFAAQLHRLDIDVEVRAAMETTVVGYWLMYPAADLPRARENLRRLQALGLTDLWLFERGPRRGAISLGLYSQLSRAEAVARRLRSRAIDVAVLPRHRRSTVFWVRMRKEPFPGWLANLTPGLEGRHCRHSGESAVLIPWEAAVLADDAAASPRL